MNASRIDATYRAVLADGVFLAVRLGAGAPLLDLCRAARRGGLPLLEITLTTPGALEAIRTLAADADALVGAGTVLTVDDVRAVAEAGARFAMSPVLDPAVVAEAHRLGMLAIPGGGSATEILAAHRAGAKLVKVFPSGPLGGPDFLRKIRGPLPHIPLVPTSGPAIETFADYVDAGAVAVGVGSEVFAPGFTPESVEGAAQRTRDAWRRAHK
ncbi:MAG: bifunctional 4-hydroxy-2-oxoglutarate aldolase/2-dehydro-3-deoxy-phosphogluconate aldolase [Gemmatimonadetes bacterium]|nr:bifunctional 4-hydroxy-2-oxoglutarate aldolase/2-dehydro-3-deoxy-phosphogluconate aldolase [Gemmatimonadota bacterium]